MYSNPALPRLKEDVMANGNLATVPKIDQKKDAKIKRIVSKKLNKPDARDKILPIMALGHGFWCFFLSVIALLVGAFTFFPAGIEGAFAAALKTYREGMK